MYIIDLGYLLHFLHILIHQYNTWQKMTFILILFSPKLEKRSIKFKGSTLWNNLPIDIKEIQSCSSFKFKLKDYFLQLLE